MTETTLHFQKIHKEYHTKILHYLLRVTGNREDAEDLTQEAFIKILNGLYSFKGKSSLSTWIYRIATNTAIDRMRGSAYKRLQKKTVSEDIEPDHEENKKVWSGKKMPLAENQIVRKEMNTCIRNFIDTLSSNYKTVLVLSEIEDFTNREIAEILGISLNTVKIRLHRAREKLRKILETRCDFYRSDTNELACDLKTVFTDLKKQP